MDNITSYSTQGLGGLLNTELLRGRINVPGLIGVIVFYIVILVVGIVASWWGMRKNKQQSNTASEDVMIAGRNIGLFVGIFTMTATWVGGGYINGTAEFVFTPGYGLIWTQAPVAYAISLVLGGLFFARKMRDAGYVTMLDPFRRRYGRVMAALLYIPALLGDIFWTAAILSALGSSLSVIIGLNHIWAVIISAAITILYTFIGGLYSVAYTDVIQLICIIVGLWLVIPFAMLHPAVTSIANTANKNSSWLGEAPTGYWIGNYVDSALLLILGGIPWQVYFQRVLSQRTSRGSTILSLAAGLGCIILAIPAVIIGAIAASTDWNATSYREFGDIPVPSTDYPLALPMVMQFLTPVPVAVIGLGAVSAAVMSSADSSVLSSSSMFARNVYQPLRNALAKKCCKGNEASEREVVWVMRAAVIVVGVSAAVMGIKVQSVYGLWYLCADLVYVILFPQLLCVIYLPFTNVYGSLVGYIVGWILRLLGGEALINLDPVIVYPWYDQDSGYQLFPFKTLTMIISFITIVVSSLLFRILCGNHLTNIEVNSYDMTTGEVNTAYDGEIKSEYRNQNDDNNISGNL